MADCMKSCKRTANARQTVSSSSSCSSSKRSKLSVSPDEVFLPQPLNRRFPNISPRNSGSSGADSRSSSNESLDIVKDRFRLVDLELEARSETDVSTCINGNKFSRENTPSSELRADPSSEEIMDSPAKNRSHRRKEQAAGKTPPQEEIEEFFTAAENYEQKRFAEKYNFDTVKDLPLEGRYQWVRLKPLTLNGKIRQRKGGR